MNPFIEACKKGQLDQAKRIAQENPDLDIHAYEDHDLHIYTCEDNAFGAACRNGHLDVARWLVDYATSIESPVDIHAKKDYAFRWACSYGHLDVARWLVDYATSIESPVDIHAYSDYAFRWACRNGHFEVARWLVSYATSIESPVDIHAESDFAFRSACRNGHLEVARWLIPFGGMPIQRLQKHHPIRLFHVGRFPTIALLSVYFRRFLYGFRERFYCPGGKGYEAAKKDFEKWTQLP